MIINRGKKTIEEALKKLMKDQADARWRQINKLIDYYHGDQTHYLDDYLVRSDLDDMPFTYTNLTRKIINKKSMVYKRPPSREYDGNYEQYEEITQKKNKKLKMAERMARLLPFIAVRPIWREDKFDYQIVRAFRILESDDPEEPFAIMYPIAGTGTQIIWEYWDSEQHKAVNNWGNKVKDQADYGIDDNENQYGELPFAFLRMEDVYDDIWQGGADDLINANEMINLALTELNFEYRWASFKQPYATAENEINTPKLEWGYNKLVKIEGEQANFGVLDLSPNFRDNIEVIKTQANLIAQNYGVNFDWSLEASSPKSGFALVVQNIDLLQDWQDDIDICREWEGDLLDIERKVLEVDAKKGIKVPEDIYVNYQEVKFPINQTEEDKHWEWMFKNNLATKRDWKKAQDPDMSEDELDKWANELVEAQAQEQPKPKGFQERIKEINA